MKRLAGYFVLLLILNGVAFAGVEKPNIIFVLLDDLGKEWIGYMRN